MNENGKNITADLSVRMNEAKVYNSMGLYDEAMAVYEGILADLPELPPHNQEKVRGMIERLKQESAAGMEAVEVPLSSDDISSFKDQIAASEDPQAILDGAEAFKEMGLFSEAVAQYMQLLPRHYPQNKLVAKIGDCILRTDSQEVMMAETDEALRGLGLPVRAESQIRFMLGRKMEDLGQGDLAVAFYRSARSINAEDPKITEALEAKIMELSTRSPFGYLLYNDMITREQLNQAIEITKRENISLGTALMESFQVDKREIGKSLSLFFDCPFRAYEHTVPVPFELIRQIQKPTLVNEGWVPLGWGKRGIEILMDDPKDLDRADRIRRLMKADKVHFSVGLKEDISAFIDRFYKDKRFADIQPSPVPGEGVELAPEVATEVAEMRKQRRVAPYVPEFVHVEFLFGATPNRKKSYRLNIIDYSDQGFGLLLPKKNEALRNELRPGDVIKDITFYATWTLIKVDARVVHVTKIREGAFSGQYVIGVESSDIIESAKIG